MIKRENYITIHGWMITDLGLSGIELLLYAVIFGFSQDGESVFKGSQNYLAEWCGCSRRSVIRSLNSLIDRGAIKQVYHSSNNLEVHYIAVLPCDKMSQPLVTECHNPCDKMSQPINDDNIEDKLADNIADKREARTRAHSPFIPPTLDQVKEYSDEIGNNTIDPVIFFELYESNGWIQGTNKKIRDWRAAFRLWVRREKSKKKPENDNSGTAIMIRTDYDMNRDDIDEILSEG